MKLLLDENLSDRIVYSIIDLYPSSEHVKTLGLMNTDDGIILVLASCEIAYHHRSVLKQIESVASDSGLSS